MIRMQKLEKNLFLNKQLFSDVTFKIEDKLIYGHKAIITSRCDVLRAMISGSFSESREKIVEFCDTQFDSFLPIIEFLYTDHAPIDEHEDKLSLLAMANRFGLPRLVSLCELYGSKMVEIATKDGIANANIDVIGILHFAQLHNANQLATFCLHFIATNYQPMKNRAEFKTLEGDNLKYVEENQWPPISYLKQLKEYESTTKKTDYCCVM